MTKKEAGGFFLMQHYHTPNLPPLLTQSVCESLYIKRQGLSRVEINMEKMCLYFKSDAVVLEEIIKWYESQLLDTRFVILHHPH